MIHGHSDYRFLRHVWHELLGLVVLWIMWLVGAAVTTHDFPWVVYRGFGLENHLISAIIAWSWIIWVHVLLNIVLALMTFAAIRAVPAETAKIDTTTARV